MAQNVNRTDLIANRLLPSRRRRQEEVDLPRLSLRFCGWLVVTSILVCIVTFPFEIDLMGMAGVTVLIGAGVALFWTYVSKYQRKNLDTGRRQLLYAGLVITLLLAARLAEEFDVGTDIRMLLLPAPLIAMILTIVYDQRFALDHLILLFLVIALQNILGTESLVLEGPAIAFIGTSFVGALVAVLLTRNLRNRIRLLKVGFVSGVVMALSMFAFELIHLWNGSKEVFTLETLSWAGLFVAHGVVTGILVTSLIPIFELVFGIVTEIRLLELEDGNHPLLKTMLERSPGTYMHTQNVARLAVAGVEAFGGNTLVTRVGTLFHDLGKMVRPEYFTENEQQSKLYHDRLTPQMSAMIIISHVKEGVEIARQHKLPRILEDFITGHHGTSSVKYFYHKAKMEATKGERIDESQFRYPGPKPQTREAAIVAIADQAEAAGRAKLQGAQTPATIQKFVHECVMSKLNDGQFDECDLTLQELKLAEDAIIKTMASMYHHRVKYPDDPDAKKQKLAMLEKEEYRKELAKRRERILTQ